MEIEKVTPEQLRALRRMLSPIAAVVAGLNQVDLTRGRGILKGDDRCLWTREGYRITVSVPESGGLIVNRSKEPDPEAPKTGEMV